LAMRKIYRGESGTMAAEFGTPERVDFHLETWKRWKSTGEHQGAYGSVAVGLSSGGASQAFDDMADASERRCARIVDVLIDDLPAIERHAIYHEYFGIHYEPREGHGVVLPRAKRTLGRGLAAKGIY
jgi:hypothetical protein